LPPEGKVTANFDNNDLLLATTALDGLVTKYDYDPAQRLVAVHQPGTTRPTTMQYDALEHVINVTNSNGASTAYQFDTLNRVQSMIYPGGSSESYGYDSNNNLVSWNRGAYNVGYTYDTLDRLTNINSPPPRMRSPLVTTISTRLSRWPTTPGTPPTPTRQLLGPERHKAGK